MIVLVFIRFVFRFVGLLNLPPLTRAGVGEYAETSPAKSRVIERRRSCLSQIAYEPEAETPHQFRSGSPFAYSRYSISFRSVTMTRLSAPSTGLEGVVLDPPY
jgi:hypothetical protein